MLAYLVRRLLLMIPTIFGIMAVSFAIVQFVPGGPVERAIAQLQGANQSSTAGFGGGGVGIGAGGTQSVGDISSRYRGSQGLDPKFIKELEKQYGFDKPAWERFWILVRDYATFDFGKSYYRDTDWVAHWDAFSRPDRQPTLGTGAPGTWWWDEAKAKAIGL